MSEGRGTPARGRSSEPALPPYPQRWRLGVLGSEPSGLTGGTRRTVAYLAALLGPLACARSVEVAVVIELLALGLGVPSRWVWDNDRLSGFSWILGGVLLAAGEVVYLVGGPGARAGWSSHGAIGASTWLITACDFAQILGYIRRWGSSGNVFLWSRMIRRGDPILTAIAAERMRRDGIEHVPGDED